MPIRAVDTITDRVLEVSGKPVVVNADPTIKPLAMMHPARGSAPAHLFSYKPEAAAFVDYMLASQCGLLLRVFALPESQRFDLGPSYRGNRETEKLVNESVRQANLPLNKAARLGVRDQLIRGLGTQLRSMPIGLRVDNWIMEQYPELKDQQRESIQRQLQDNLSSLLPEVRRLTAEPIYAANVGMSAAFALFWARAWTETPLTTPYKATGYLALGEELLTIWDKIPADPANDRTLIEAWADRLGIRTWFEFVPGPTT